MAVKKAQDNYWLLLHVGTYTIILALGVALMLPLKEALIYAGINGGLHLITDFFTSKAASKFAHRPRVFYPILGFDQFLHLTTLILTLDYLT